MATKKPTPTHTVVPLEHITESINQINMAAARAEGNAQSRSCSAVWRRSQGVVQAVKRNAERFPHDFVFQLTK